MRSEPRALRRIVASAAFLAGGAGLASEAAADCSCDAEACLDAPSEAAIRQPPTRQRDVDATSDPWQPANRLFFGISEMIDRNLLGPIAKTYRRIVPRPIRGAARNVIANLDEPVVAVNDVLQGRLGDAAGASGRFLANSTIGVAGIFDVVGGQGLHHHDNDFGLTLGRWGIPAGPYVYLPVAGATSLRDLAGAGFDFALDPLNAANFRGASGAFTGEVVVGVLDERSLAEDELQTLDRMALDRYATVRSIYLQARQSEVRDANIELAAMPDFPDVAETPAAAASPAPNAPGDLP